MWPQAVDIIVALSIYSLFYVRSARLSQVVVKSFAEYFPVISSFKQAVVN